MNIILAESHFNLLVVPVASETCEVLREAHRLAVRHPELLRAIMADQDAHGVAKKRRRLRVRSHGAGPELPRLCGGAGAVSVVLGEGRPRLSPLVVLFFLTLRGLYGSVSDAEAADRFAESISVRLLLEDLGLRERPARSTLVENLNAVSNGTRELLLDCQLADILAEGLDDFRELMVDSTAVKGCSAHPNEARLAWAFLERPARLLANLAKAGHGRFLPGWTEAWLGEMKQLAFEINTVRGKASRRRRKRLYRQLLTRGDKVFAHLQEQANAAFAGWQSGAGVRPYRIHAKLQGVLAQVMADLAAAGEVMARAEQRVLKKQKVVAAGLVLSLADTDAAIIVKGGREPVMGYKPGLGRSRNGFVCAFRVESGNPADAPELAPLVRQAIARTQVIPDVVVADDGYASRAGVNEVKAMGIVEMHVTGAKGRKLTPPEQWESETARHRRSRRSAVESLMFTLKHEVAFGRMRRRGLDAVKAEMLEKIIAYNFSRIIQVRSQLQENAAAPPLARLQAA